MTDLQNLPLVVVNDVLGSLSKPFTESDGPCQVLIDDLVSDNVVANASSRQKARDLALSVAMALRARNIVQFRIEYLLGNGKLIIWDEPTITTLTDANI